MKLSTEFAGLRVAGSAAAVLVLGLCAAPEPAAPEQYRIDPEHTYPSFEFSHMGLSVWRGKFDRSSGQIVLDRAARTGSVDVKIDPASIDFGLASIEEKARSEDFFNVAKYPGASYRGTLRFEGDIPKTVDGEITLLGVTRPLKLAILSFKCMPHPLTRKEVCGADAEGEVNWSEYGMKLSQYGRGELGRTRLRIQVEALKQER